MQRTFYKALNLRYFLCNVVKKLVGVTKKLPSGGLHTKFQDSSSSSDSDSSSSSSESSSSSSEAPAQPQVSKGGGGSSSKAATSKSASQWDVKKTPASKAVPRLPPKAISTDKAGAQGRAAAVQTAKQTPGAQGKAATVQPARRTSAGGSIGSITMAKPARARQRRRRARRGRNASTLTAGAVIGGPGDVLTTKSFVLTSPVGEVSNVRVTDLAASLGSRREGVVGGAMDGDDSRMEEEEEEEGAGQGVEGSADDFAVHAARTTDHSALSASLADCSTSLEAARDYSGFAALQGMPRVGDTLAFKVGL